MNGFTSKILSELLGNMPMVIVKADPYFGSFIRFDAVSNDGSAILIRIYLCDWCLVENSKVRATSSSDIENWSSIIGSLDGCKLLDFLVHATELLELVFDSNRSMLLRANLEEYGNDDDLLRIIYDGSLVGYSPASGFAKEALPKSIN